MPQSFQDGATRTRSRVGRSQSKRSVRPLYSRWRLSSAMGWASPTPRSEKPELRRSTIFQRGRTSRKKELEQLLVDWSSKRQPIYAVFPSRRNVPAKVRVFMAFARRLLLDHGKSEDDP